MRNLKKFLALVLAMIMAFSLMISANAATTGPQFDDAKDVTPAFEEAVDVLVGMKVFQGDEKGFRPASNITRAEVAVLIYRLATGDTGTEKVNLYTTTHPFTDVHADDWFAGYVGYCWNAGYIKGNTKTTFNPYGNVTGYEVLAMILRAVGYDKNDEYTGGDWIVKVSATSQQRGILNDVKSTHYGDTLHLASRRDVVASLLFNAAQIAQVMYTPAFGYQTTGMDGGVVGAKENPSLGRQNFGLIDEERIVVGNQETGEKSTVMGATENGTFEYTDSGNNKQTATYTMYAYPGGLMKKAAENANTTADVKYPDTIGVKLDVKTGLELFGHKLKVWYDCRPATIHTTYAYYDKADSALVDGSRAANAAAGKDAVTVAALDNLAPDNLTVGTRAHISESFARITDRTYSAFTDNAAKTSTTTTNSPEDLYVLIDNTADGVVDVVIPLNIQTSKITAADNVNAVKTVQAPMATTLPAFDADTTTSGWVGLGGTEALIEQDALVGDSTTTIGDYEIGLRINGTSRDSNIANTQIDQVLGAQNSGDLSHAYRHNHTSSSGHAETALYRLAKLDNTKEGQVASFNDADGIIVLSDGTRLERSPFYHTVVGNNFYNVDPNAAATSISAEFQSWQEFATGDWKEGYTNGTYRFYLDADGKYVGAKRVQDLGFIYGTYMDYDQVTSSSSFNYYVTGVNLDGEIVKQQKATRFDGAVITGTDQVGIPYRDTYNSTSSAQSVNGIGNGVYQGMTVNDTTLSSYTTSLGIIGVIQGNGTNNADSTKGVDNFDNVTIRSGDTTLGAKAAKPATTTLPGGDVAATSTNSLYFTNNTKFILVSGYGTDSVKAEVYNGITELRGDSTSVNIAFNKKNTSDSVNIPHIKDVSMEEMTYFTKSDFVYAQTLGTLSEQVDTIILPKAAVTWVGGSSTYYVGNPTATLWNGNVTGEKATQFTMYQGGEAFNMWVEGLSYEAKSADPNTVSDGVNDAAYVAEASDTFWTLVPTSKKTNTGETIYKAGSYGTGAASETFTAGTAVSSNTATVTAVNNTRAHVVYRATTYDAQVALINNVLRNVGTAKIVNLNAANSPIISNANGTTTPTITATSGYVWPGIDNTLANLNNAGSVAGTGAYSGQYLYVSVEYGTTNATSGTAQTIYVCWDQNEVAQAQ